MNINSQTYSWQLRMLRNAETASAAATDFIQPLLAWIEKGTKQAAANWSSGKTLLQLDSKNTVRNSCLITLAETTLRTLSTATAIPQEEPTRAAE